MLRPFFTDFNLHHDPHTGRFTSKGGSAGLASLKEFSPGRAGSGSGAGRMHVGRPLMFRNERVTYVGPGDISQRIRIQFPDGREETVYRARTRPAEDAPPTQGKGPAAPTTPTPPPPPAAPSGGRPGAVGRLTAGRELMVGGERVTYVGAADIPQRVRVRGENGEERVVYRQRLAPLPGEPAQPSVVEPARGIQIPGNPSGGITDGGRYARNHANDNPAVCEREAKKALKEIFRDQRLPEVEDGAVTRAAKIGYPIADILKPYADTLPESGLYVRSGEITLDHPGRVDVTLTGFDIELRRKFRRHFSGEGVSVDHTWFHVPDGQGKGMGKKLTTRLFQSYAQHGVREVTTHPGLAAGGYVWARFGFVPSSPDTMYSLGQKILGNLAAARTGSRVYMRNGEASLTSWFETKTGEKPDAKHWDEGLKFIKSLDWKNPKDLLVLAKSKWGQDMLSGEDYLAHFNMRDRDQITHFNEYTGAGLPVPPSR